MADKRKLIELDIDVESIISKSVYLKTTLDSLRAEQDKLKKSGDTNSETYIKLSGQISKVSSDYNLNQKQLSALAQVSGDYLNINQKVGLSLDKEAKSISEARQNNTELLKVRNELNLSKESERKLADEINAKIDKNNDFIKENVSSLEKQKIGIGDYKTAITNALNESGLFGEKLNQLKSINESVKSTFSGLKSELKDQLQSIKDVTKGTEGMTLAQKASTIATNVGSGAMNIFKVALASTGIGLLVLGLAALIGYFTQTQSGIDKLNTVIQPLKTLLSAVTNIVFDLGGKLVNTFSNPKKALQDLGEFLKQNLINRFTAFGKILDGIINLDFKKITDGTLQAATGVEDLTGKISNGAKNTSEFLKESLKRGSEIAKLGKEIEEGQLAYNKLQRENGDLIDTQLLISKDTSKTFKEREAASREIIRLTKELGVEEEAIIDKKIRQLNLQNQGKDITNEEKQKIEDLLNAKENAGDRGIEAEKEQMKVIAGARKEAADKAIQFQTEIIDNAINKSKQEIDLFITSQGFKKKSQEEEMIFERQLVEEKQALLKYQLDKKRITETEYNNENLKLLNEYGLKFAQMVSENAKIELDEFLLNNKSKIDANQFITDELVNQELDRINRISEARAEEATTRLVQGIINQQEYNQAIKEIDDQYETEKKTLLEDKKTADIEQKSIDLENQKTINQLEFESQFIQKQQELEIRETQEVEAAKKSGASVDLIHKKFASLKKQLDKDVAEFKLNQEIGIVQGLKGLVNEESVLGKSLAVAEIGLNTIKNATQAFQQAAVLASNPLTAPLAVNANIQGGIIIATGVAQTAKIAGIKLKDGAIDIDGPGTETSDSIPAMISKGESVINAKSTAAYKPLLQAINDGVGLTDLNLSRNYSPSNIYNNINNNQNSQNIDIDLLAFKIGENVAMANKNLPIPKVITTIESINTAQKSYNDVVQGADF